MSHQSRYLGLVSPFQLAELSSQFGIWSSSNRSNIVQWRPDAAGTTRRTQTWDYVWGDTLEGWGDTILAKSVRGNTLYGVDPNYLGAIRWHFDRGGFAQATRFSQDKFLLEYDLPRMAYTPRVVATLGQSSATAMTKAEAYGRCLAFVMADTVCHLGVWDEALISQVFREGALGFVFQSGSPLSHLDTPTRLSVLAVAKARQAARSTHLGWLEKFFPQMKPWEFFAGQWA